MFWQPRWGCTFSTLPHTPHHTGLHPACASWWYLCAPSPTCHGWATHRTLWVCCIWVLGSAGWWPGHLLQWSGGGPARPGWQNGSRMSHTPEDGSRGTQFWNVINTLTPTTANSDHSVKLYLSIRACVDSVVVHSPLIAERNWQLSWAALTFPDQETAIDEGWEQVFCGAAWHRPVVPAVLLQTVDWRDVVGGHPTLAVLWAHFAPLPILVVAQHTQLLTWTWEGKLVRPTVASWTGVWKYK